MNLLLLAVLLAWAGVALTPLAVRLFGRFAGWPLGAVLLAAFGAITAARASGTESVVVPWIPSFDVALRLRLDGLGFLFSVLILVIGAIVLVYSSSYLRAARSPGFYALMTAFAAAMLTLVVADDLIVLFVAWEITTLCSYLLILRSGPNAVGPATRTLMVTVAGGLALLAAVALVVARTGTTHLTAALQDPAWSADPVFAGTAAVLVALAAMTKSAQFPFHSWLPDAMVAPAPVSAYLHAAAMVKAGIFLLMLFSPAAAHSGIWAPLLISTGLITSVLGAVLALRATDIKQVMAYSTVSQLGLLVATIGIGSAVAMLAASAHILAHGLFKSSAFMGVGLIERRAGSRDVRELRGLWRGMRGDAAAITLALLSMAGMIPLMGFVSKELIFEAFLDHPAGNPLALTLGLLAAGSAVLTVAYCARVLFLVLPGPRRRTSPWRESAAMSGAVWVTAAAGLVLGPVVFLLDGIVRPAAAAAANHPVTEIAHLYLWHGVNVPLMLSAAALALGTGLAWITARAVGTTPSAESRKRRTGTDMVQAVLDWTISSGNRVGTLTRTDSPAGNLAVPVGLIGLAVIALPRLWNGWPVHLGAIHLLDGLLVLSMAAGIIAVIRSKRRLTSVISVGVVGFSVVLWFFVLGASDVALTQLLVEILTVVVMVLVLRNMPVRFPAITRRRRATAAIAALAAGATTTLAALVFTGSRDFSPVAEYFLRNAEELTGGTNVVNTILVDFRALDTLGELVVLAICAVSLTVLLDARRTVNRTIPQPAVPLIADPHANAVFLRVLGRLLLPVMVIGSAYIFMRGHNAPGGGFIAALVGAGAIALYYLSAPTDRVEGLQKPYLVLAGAGIATAVVTGLLGFADGSFLRPLHLDILGYHLTTALIFDLGVYFAVLGVVLATINRLGLAPPEQPGTAPPATETPHTRTDEEVAAP
ncbi:MAG: proton-conducting transporter membrane subunit [bacterium]|nr:proton-conducting transporter membrane subunit [bacterium]